ncbi:hypothetical protein [Micromonospora sp. DPT]|uniref:hypothetical protein n=1 Tax=Micromonospora sp. DPT TaxID=3142975 RepID=UPI003208E381
MTEQHRPDYIALVAALRAEFLPTSLDALWIQMRGHRYNTTSLGVLAQAVHDARDLTYDTGDDLRAELEKVRAELAEVRNQAHRDHTEHQQVLRDKTALTNERDLLKAEVRELNGLLDQTSAARDRFRRERDMERECRRVELFNAIHPVGTTVRYWKGVREGDGKTSTTRTEAQLLSGHTAVVWLEGVSGCIALTHIEPVAAEAVAS